MLETMGPYPASPVGGKATTSDLGTACQGANLAVGMTIAAYLAAGMRVCYGKFADSASGMRVWCPDRAVAMPTAAEMQMCPDGRTPDPAVGMRMCPDGRTAGPAVGM